MWNLFFCFKLNPYTIFACCNTLFLECGMNVDVTTYVSTFWHAYASTRTLSCVCSNFESINAPVNHETSRQWTKQVRRRSERVKRTSDWIIKHGSWLANQLMNREQKEKQKKKEKRKEEEERGNKRITTCQSRKKKKKSKNNTTNQLNHKATNQLNRQTTPQQNSKEPQQANQRTILHKPQQTIKGQRKSISRISHSHSPKGLVRLAAKKRENNTKEEKRKRYEK